MALQYRQFSSDGLLTEMPADIGSLFLRSFAKSAVASTVVVVRSSSGWAAVLGPKLPTGRLGRARTRTVTIARRPGFNARAHASRRKKPPKTYPRTRARGFISRPSSSTRGAITPLRSPRLQQPRKSVRATMYTRVYTLDMFEQLA